MNAKQQNQKISNLSEKPAPETTRGADFKTEFEKIADNVQNSENILTRIAENIQEPDIKDQLEFVASSISKAYTAMTSETQFYKAWIEKQQLNGDDKTFLIENFMADRVVESPVNQHKRTVKRKSVFPGGDRLDQESDMTNVMRKIGKDWHFDAFFLADCMRNALPAVAKHLMKRFNIMATYDIDDDVANEFFLAIEAGYLQNAYHNSTHAIDVLCSTIFFIENSSLLSQMTELDTLGCIIAAAGHDVGHPALTNRFLINSRDKLATMYNDRSVLEQMHCSMTFQFLKDSKTDILANFSSENWQIIRRIMVDMILATDMSKHFKMLGKFRLQYLSNTKNLADFEERLAVLKIGIKCADVGHAAKSLDLHERWSVAVCEEFFNQGDLEKSKNLTISMYCDRETADIPKQQAGFLKNMAMPLYDAFNSYLQSEQIQNVCIEQLNKNHDYWVNTNIVRMTSKDDEEYPQDLFNQIASRTRKTFRTETLNVLPVSQNSFQFN